MTLTEFLRARLEEDEKTALKAAGAVTREWSVNWHFDPDYGSDGILNLGDQQEALGAGSNRTDPLSLGQAHHIARHDPARVLVDVEAKRRIVAEIFEYEATEDGEFGCCHSAEDIATRQCPGTDPDKLPALRLLALPYADHPDYREEWRP